MKITHEQFGQICSHVAKSLTLGLKSDVAVQLAVTEFARLDPVDVADIAEGAIDQWQRLQVEEPRTRAEFPSGGL